MVKESWAVTGQVNLALRAISAGIVSMLAMASHPALAQSYVDPGRPGDAASWQTPEFYKDWGLAAMNTQYAYARGATGKNVSVGVVDSGFYLDHPEFKNRGVEGLTVTGVASEDSYYTYDNQLNLLKKGQPFSVPADQLEFIHGTHVLGTIGAARDGSGMQGVAFDSHLIVTNSNGTDDLPYDQHLDYAYFEAAYGELTKAGARIINSSWGQNPLNAGDLTTLQNAYKTDYQGKLTFLDAGAEQATKGVDMVWTAGNSGFANPSLRASLPYFRPELAGHWLAVAWLDSANPATNGLNGSVKIDGSSNKCGFAKYWCISAPGGGIYSTTFGPNDTFPDPKTVQASYGKLSGTSMAAPHASGALALVMQRYPYLGNAEALQILLTTARHLNVDPNVPDQDQNAPNAIYGWGIPDLNKAMNGPGQLGILMSGDAFSDGQARLINPVFNATLPANVSDTWTNDISGPGGLFKDGPGSLVLTGANTYQGVTTVNGGRLEINGSLASPTAIEATGVLAGSGIVTASVQNAGAISPGASSDAPAHGTLTIRGNYQGNGGLLKLNTVLGSDDSASDTLVIDGGKSPVSATGNTQVLVSNAGGAGAQTNRDGIMVVQALGQATTAPGAFSLLGGVRAGAYDYRLFRGGLVQSDASAQQDWFLRSTFVEPPNQSGNPPSTPATVAHIVGPELSVYGSAAPTAQWLTLSTLGTLHERTGNLAGGQDGSTGDDRHAWARVIGQSFNAQFSSSVSPTTSGTLTGVQAGTDVWHGTDGLIGGKDRVGAYFSYAHATADVQGLVTNAAATANAIQDTGNISLDGWSLATYWTHTGNGGWYTDLVAQATVYSGRAASDRTSISLHGHGVTGSLEFGYPIALTPRWTIEPRAQIVAQRVQLSAEQDAYGAVSPGNTSGLFGSVGLRTQYTLDMGNWTLQPYAFANLWSSLGSVNGSTVYSGADQVTTDSGARWLQAGGGLSAKVSDRVNLYMRLSGELNMGNNPRHGIEGDAGVRVVW